jgi:hypothetical protein
VSVVEVVVPLLKTEVKGLAPKMFPSDSARVVVDSVDFVTPLEKRGFEGGAMAGPGVELDSAAGLLVGSWDGFSVDVSFTDAPPLENDGNVDVVVGFGMAKLAQGFTFTGDSLMGVLSGDVCIDSGTSVLDNWAIFLGSDGFAVDDSAFVDAPKILAVGVFVVDSSAVVDAPKRFVEVFGVKDEPPKMFVGV